MISRTEQRRNSATYTYSLHFSLATIRNVRCSSLSLIRALTWLRIHHDSQDQAPSKELIAAMLMTSVQLVDARNDTLKISQEISKLTKFTSETLNSLQLTLISGNGLAQTDMLDFFQSLMLTTPVWVPWKDDLLKASNILGVVIAMLAFMGHNPRENLMPQITGLLWDQLDGSSTDLVRAGLEAHFREPARLPHVFLRHEGTYYMSRSRISQGNLEIAHLVQESKSP